MTTRNPKNRVCRFFGRLLYAPVRFLPSCGLFCSLRTAAARLILTSCGRRVRVERGARFASDVVIGDHSALGRRASVGTGTTIGRDVMMGEDCLILTCNHEISRTDIPMREQGAVFRPVWIGDDVWIGARVTILPGSVIGNGAVIGAGSVVRGTVAAGAVVIGNPAVPIRQRGSGSAGECL